MSRFARLFTHDMSPDEVRMTLGEHLEELRTRVIRALVALAVGAIICHCFIDKIMGFLTSPVYAAYRKHGLKPAMQTLGPAEQFLTYLKVAIIVGFILSAPYSMWQIWKFVAAGLYQRERRWVYRFAPTSIALFFAGALFLLLVVSPLLLDFLLSYPQSLPEYGVPSLLLGEGTPLKTETQPASWPTSQPIMAFDKDPQDPPEGVLWVNLRTQQIRIQYGHKVYDVAHLQETVTGNRLDPTLRLSEYVVFILTLSAAFGVSFQVPVVVTFVATLRIASAAQMGSLRRYIWFAMAIAAAVVTPTTDVISMGLLLVPMVALLEVGLLVARMIERARGETGTA